MKTETFAVRLRKARGIRGYTQEELAAITGVSVQSIRRLEQSKCNAEPNAYHLLRLARALDVSPDYLL